MPFTLEFSFNESKFYSVGIDGSGSIDQVLPGRGRILGVLHLRHGVKYHQFYESFAKLSYPSEMKECIDTFSHQYMLIFHDASSDKLFIFKDFSGCESSYYTFANDRLIVSSDVNSIVERISNVSLNPEAALQFVYCEMVCKPLTLYEDVYAFINDSVYTLEKGASRFCIDDQFVIPKSGEEKCSDPKALRDRITNAHNDRIGSENGIYLSGGVDSQVMTIALKKDLGLANISAFNFYVKGSETKEVDDARRVAKSLELDFVPVEVDPQKKIDFDYELATMNSPYLGAVSLKELLSEVPSKKELTVFAGQDTRLHTPALTKSDIAYWHLLGFLGGNLPDVGSKVATAIGKACFKFKNSDKAGRFERLITNVSRPDKFLAYRHFHVHGYDFIRETLENSSGFRNLSEELKNINFRDPRAAYNLIVELNWRRQYLFDIEYMIQTTRYEGHDCVMPFYDRELAYHSARLNFRQATRFTKGREGHSSKEVAVNKYLLRQAYFGELDPSLIFREKAVCPTSYLFFNNGLSAYVKRFIQDNSLEGSELGRRLNISQLISLAASRHKGWRPEDNSFLVTLFNAMVIESIHRRLSY